MTEKEQLSKFYSTKEAALLRQPLFYYVSDKLLPIRISKASLLPIEKKCKSHYGIFALVAS
jgi:hypothetical protein